MLVDILSDCTCTLLTNLRFDVAQGRFERSISKQFRRLFPSTWRRMVCLEMGIGGWIAIILIIWIIVIVLLRVSGVVKPAEEVSPDIEALIATTRQRTSWGKPQDVPNGNRNQCAVYTFPATGPNQQGVPTLNTNTLDSLIPAPIAAEVCVDPDQIAAKQQVRTCLGDGDTGNTCINSEGNVFQKGQNEVLYVPCEAPKCKDTLSLVALNFQNTTSNNRCVTDLGGEIIATGCDLRDPSQYYRIERADPVTLQENNNGTYAKVQNRETGMCLVPSNLNPVAGTSLTLGPCVPNQGFVWFLAPPVTIDGEITPQQLVYTSSVADPPSPGEMEDYIETNNPLSMEYTDPQNVTLQPFAKESTGNQGYVSQFLDYRIYQVLQETEFGPSGINIPYYNWSTAS